jgi:molybdopterin converting factor small subunit
VTLKVKLFGAEAHAAGAREVAVALEGRTCASLRAALERSVPALQPFLSKCRFAVNHEFATDDRILSESDEIALIGMVSGG